MQKQGTKVVSDKQVARVEKDSSSGRKKVIFSDSTSVDCDEVVVTLGRIPNVDELNMDALDIQTNPKKEIAVDA